MTTPDVHLGSTDDDPESTAVDPDPPAPATATASVRRLTAWLLAATAALAVANVGAFHLALDDRRLAGAELAFNSDIEMSVPTWFSLLLFVAAAGVMGLLALAPAERRYRRNWQFLAVVFLALSIDEIVAYHEYWTGDLRESTGLGGIFFATWVVVGIPLVVLFVISQVRFLAALPRVTAVRMVVAGAVFVTGALGLEMFGAWYAERYGGVANFRYYVIAAVEEVCEMVGLVLFLRAVLLHLVDRSPRSLLVVRP